MLLKYRFVSDCNKSKLHNASLYPSPPPLTLPPLPSGTGPQILPSPQIYLRQRHLHRSPLLKLHEAQSLLCWRNGQPRTLQP
eukprot:10452079-Ditylum_brightwellii.AAC.1